VLLSGIVVAWTFKENVFGCLWECTAVAGDRFFWYRGRESVPKEAHSVLTGESVTCDEPEKGRHGRSRCLCRVGCALLFRAEGFLDPTYPYLSCVLIRIMLD
jgi:hypothetical protein